MRRALLLAGATSLAACSMEPPVPRTALPVPAAFPAGGTYLAASQPLPALSYTALFTDPRLQQLLRESFAANRDLRIAAEAIVAARAQVVQTRSDLFPELDAAGRATVSGGDGDRRVSTSAQLSVPSFELDLFGRIASMTKADRELFLASEANARAVRLALVADVARAWATYAADASLLTVATRTAVTANERVRIAKARLEGGISPRTDLLQAQQVLETALGDQAAQRAQLAKDVNLLQLLVGAPIDPALLPADLASVAPSFHAPPAGLDSRVLLRRPDVVQTEHQLYSANADIGAARAALFPNISLTGLLGLASSGLTGLFSGGAFSWSGGGGVSYPIFRAGAGRARVTQTEAQRNAALARYEKAIQTAFREVADALADAGTLGERVRSAASSVALTQDTLRLSELRYRNGIDPYLSTLDAQRTFYGAQRTEVTLRLLEVRNRIDLYEALGAESAF